MAAVRYNGADAARRPMTPEKHARLRRIDKIARWLLGASAAVFLLFYVVSDYAAEITLLRGGVFLLFADAVRYALHLAAPLREWRRRGKRLSLKHLRKLTVIFFAAFFITLSYDIWGFSASAPAENAADFGLPILITVLAFIGAYAAINFAIILKMMRTPAKKDNTAGRGG